MLLALLLPWLALATPQPPPAARLPIWIFVQETDDQGLVRPDLKDCRDSLRDFAGGLHTGSEPLFRPVATKAEAIVLIEILGRSVDPKDHDVRTVRAKVTAGPHSRVFEGHNDDGSWGDAARDAAKQARAWVVNNRAVFAALK